MQRVAVALFLAQIAATLLMTGLIWFVQIVHYPLFAIIDDRNFVSYARRHATLTGYLVGGPMLLELATALLALLPRLRPWFFPGEGALLSAGLVLLIWAATGLVQVPLHARLSRIRDCRTIDRLVATNWLRTILWSSRSILLLLCLLRALLPRGAGPQVL